MTIPSPSTAPAPVAADLSDVERALCRSALYEALALGFRPPTAETVTRLATPDGAAGLVAAAEALDPALATTVARLAASRPRLGPLQERFARLFGHAARGVVAVHETEYGGQDLFQQPQELADVAGFYAAFDLALAPAADARVDHLSCECEFLMFLARKEAVALERADAAMLDATRGAVRLFLRDHLGRFAPTLAAALGGADGDGFYGRLAAVTELFVAHECAAVGVTPGPATLALRPPVDDRIPMACGTCPLGGGADAPDPEEG